VGDQKITHNVETAIRNYPALQAPNSVRVQTRNRVVYLYGHVNNQVELETAERAALSVDGVQRVVNSISLPYEGR
jgi:osmotically-inducible protein OsmY